MKKILVIGLITCMMVCLAFAPFEGDPVKAGTTITITFDPDGNVTLDVSPDTFDYGVIYSSNYSSSGGTAFTIWNNGTTDDMVTDAQITGGGTTNFTIDEDTIPTGEDTYAVYLIGGSASGANAWMKESAPIELDDELDLDGQDTFGFILYIANLSQNFSTDTFVVTLTGSMPY